MLTRNFTYQGDGNDDRAITINWQPDIVIIAPDSAEDCVIRFSSMVGDKSFYFNNTDATTNLIQSFTDTGMTIGTNDSVNANGVTYHVFAMKIINHAYGRVFTYQGNGVDGRQITGFGFDPTGVMIFGETTENKVFRTDVHVGDYSSRFAGACSAGLVEALISDGMQLDNDSEVNGNGITYHCFAWKDYAGFMESGTYVGNATDDRSITAGFSPAITFVKEDATGNAYLRMPSFTSGESRTTIADMTTNQIQIEEATGFQIGSGGGVNEIDKDYYWFAFVEGKLARKIHV